MKAFQLLALSAVILNPITMAYANNTQVNSSRDTVHTVETGDTLWDLSFRYLGSPWRWNAVWKNNPDIHNPHRIYPGDKIIIQEKGGATKLSVLRINDDRPITLIATSAQPDIEQLPNAEGNTKSKTRPTPVEFLVPTLIEESGERYKSGYSINEIKSMANAVFLSDTSEYLSYPIRLVNGRLSSGEGQLIAVNDAEMTSGIVVGSPVTVGQGDAEMLVVKSKAHLIEKSASDYFIVSDSVKGIKNGDLLMSEDAFIEHFPSRLIEPTPQPDYSMTVTDAIRLGSKFNSAQLLIVDQGVMDGLYPGLVLTSSDDLSNSHYVVLRSIDHTAVLLPMESSEYYRSGDHITNMRDKL